MAGFNSRYSRCLWLPIIGRHGERSRATCVMFAVDHIDDTLARLAKHGAQLVDEVVQYEDGDRLCYSEGRRQVHWVGRANRLDANALPNR